jgi:hypothetical protein
MPVNVTKLAFVSGRQSLMRVQNEVHSPFRPFRAVTDESDKVLVPHLADGFDLHLELLLSLTPETNYNFPFNF